MDFVCLKEDFENEFSASDNLPDKISRSSHKCGEIFISEEEVFNFLCTLCEAPFEEVDKFFIHVKSTHKNAHDTEKSDPLNSNKNSIDKYHPNCPENVSILCDIDILNEESSSESSDSDEVNEENCSESESDTDEHEYETRRNRNTRKIVPKKITRKKSSSNNLNDEKNADLLCDICSKDFKTPYTLRRHLKNIHNVVRIQKTSKSPAQTEHEPHSSPVLTQSESTDLNTIEADKNNSEKISHKCKYCGRQFKEKSKLEEHETIYCVDKPSECQTCGKLFITKARLRRHESSHNETREYKCDLCQSAFKSKSGLYSHMLRHGEKKYACNYCGKRFFIESEKKEHERVHTGERPFQCNYCGKCFQTNGSLSTHVKSHTGRRPHKCQYCDKSFYTKAVLNNHVVIHTGERPFVCSICKATFPRQKALRSHEKIHSDFKGYVCKICGEAFKQYAGLYCHKRSHGQPF